MNPSLLLIPDRYKKDKLYSQIPDSGAGDLTFARNSNATRVNSAGLIEKVRENLALYSEQFDNAYWSKIGTAWTVSGNTTIAPNGTLTADTLNVSNNDNFLYGSLVTALDGNEFTFSIYAKGTGTFSMNIRLNSVTTTTETKTLTSEWQRFTVSVTNAIPVISLEFYIGLNTSSTYNVWGAQAESSPVATDYIPTTTAAVSVGITADIPRLDYTGGGCPSLLLEPQRTNLITFSEQFDNAAWDKSNCTISANAITAPDGTNSADKLILDNGQSGSSGDGTGLRQIVDIASNNYTLSIFAKAGEFSTIRFRENQVTGAFLTINLLNGAITNGDSNEFINPKTELYANGWYRISFQTPTLTAIYKYSIRVSETGNGTSGIYIWGAQIEAGSYVSSYIPTLGSSVTRLADAASKTGISSLIGQTEGVIFIDFVASAQNQDGAVYSVITIFGDVNENFQLYTLGGAALRWYAFKAGVIFDELASQTLVAGQRYKIAYAYKSGDWALYINGVQKSTRTDASIPAVSQFNFNSDAFGAAVAKMENKFNAVAAYPVRLSNSELASLTSL